MKIKCKFSKVEKRVVTYTHRKQLAIFLCVLFSLAWVYRDAFSTVIHASSCSQTDVQTAITTAINGDTVTIPSGSSEWTVKVTIPNAKKIILRGAGPTSTVIISNLAGSTLELGTSGSRITQMGFILQNDNGVGISARGTGWRIDHCTFTNNENFIIEGVNVNGFSDEPSPVGVVDHCTFNNTRVLVLGDLSLAAHKIWFEPLGLGTNNAVFFEDCIFNYSIFSNAIDANYGGRYVFRYNTVNDAYIEAHAVQGNNRAARSWEIYNNTINQKNRSMWTPFFLRGGTGVVFNNVITGTWSQLKISLNSRRDTETFPVCGLCDGSSPWDGNTFGEGGYPCRDQPGRSTDQWLWTDTSQYPPQALDPVYGWNNTHNGSDVLFYVHNPGPVNHIIENRDYYNNTEKPGYVPYTYPHPMISEQDSNIISQSNITVLPGMNIEVGEETYFDAQYYSTLFGDSIQCEWDFGDGYSLRIDDIDGNPFESGLCAIHCFMNPGVFTVRLTISLFDMTANPPNRLSVLSTDSINVIVIGEAPLADFELWHAPFHARAAQYLYAKVPSGYSPAQVVVRVERSGGGYSQELTGITEGDKQRFLLNNASLPSGNYVVTAELKNGETVVSRIREKFTKSYDGAPTIGINENNAFILNGTTLFFPIGPYMLNGSSVPLWRRVSNTLHTEGYYIEHTYATWMDYISVANAANTMTIGPSVWQGGVDRGSYYARNSHLDDMALYVEQVKNSQGLLGWNWIDEPNMGGRYIKVPAHVLAGWNYCTSQIDPNHPTAQQYYGFDFFNYPNNNPRTGDYPYGFMRSASSFGGKKIFVADFFTHDSYLMEYKDHISLDFSDRGALDLWLENLEHFHWNMAGLVPLGTFIEPQNVTSFQRMSGTTYLTQWDAGPTPGDVRTQAWSAIIHNLKFIGYFQLFAPTPAANLSAMAELKETVTALTPVILSAPSSKAVTHNANSRGNRVDVMIRETDTDVYIFAARITEPESEWSEVYEPETINFQLNIGLTVSTAYDELEKYRWKYISVDASESQTDFSFIIPDGAINTGSIIVSAVKNPVTTGYPDSLYDKWTGKAYPTAYDMQGNLKYGFDDGAGNVVSLYSWTSENVTGTVNYSTGQVSLHFASGIPAGSGFVQVAYAPASRQARAISISGGIITDVLERNAVRIYRIPLYNNGGGNSNLANEIIVYQNYPNPFNPRTTINFLIPGVGTRHAVSLRIYDVLGREIRTLLDEVKDAGIHSISWDGTNSAGQRVASGVYFYQVRNNSGYKNTKKMLLME